MEPDGGADGEAIKVQTVHAKMNLSDLFHLYQ